MTLYKEFDAKASAYNERPGDLSRCVGSLTELASFLPQARAGHVPEKRASKWARKTLVMELGVRLSKKSDSASGADLEQIATEADLDAAWKQAVWHLKRACGVGGSEVAQVISHLRDGKSGNYGDARSIALQKLLVFSPLEGDEAMTRGKKMERFIREEHHAMEGSRTCEEGIRRVSGKRSERLPFLFGNPDDLTLLTKNGKNYRVVDDYKAPSVKVFEEYVKNGVPFGYTCQLHQYDMLCDEYGVKTSGMRMVALDYESGKPKAFVVPKDPEVFADIEKFGSQFWNEFVMNGIAPDEIKPKNMEIKDPKVTENIIAMSFLNTVMAAGKKKLEEIKLDTFEVFSQEDPRTVGTASLGFSSMSRKRSWDKEELIRLAESGDEPIDISGYTKTSERLESGKVKAFFSEIKKLKGADLEERVKKTKLTDLCEIDMDADKVAEILEEAGVSVITAMGTSDSFEMTRKRKGDEAEAKMRLEEMTKERLEGILSSVMAKPEETLARIRGEIFDEVSPDLMSQMPDIE